MSKNHGYFVVHVNNAPAFYKPGHFPRKFGTKKGAIEAAEAAVAMGTSFARVEFPGGGELDFRPKPPTSTSQPS